MKKRKSNKSRKRKYIKKREQKIILLNFFFFVFALLVFLFLYFFFFVFPKSINTNVKKDLIEIYKPVAFDDSDNLLILKLKQEPEIIINEKVNSLFKNKYGLYTKFEDIKGNENNGIYKLVFYKGNKIFTDVCSVYLYWDIEFETKIDSFKNETLKEIIKKDNYEKIDEKIKNQKKEKLENPEKKDFKTVTQIEKSKTNNRVKIAIIIDDLGYSYNSTYDYLTLGFPVTFSLIPEQSDSKKFYDLFNNYGYEMILHIPMEPLKGRNFVESNAIFANMDNEEIRNKVKRFLDEYPDVTGANNHMGSKVMSDERILGIVEDELSRNHKIFLDSRTNSDSVGKEVSEINHIPYYGRDEFLDNSKDQNEIRKSMDKLINDAKKKGYAIGIGHVQTKELVQVLKEYYNKSNELGIEFVPLSKLK